MDIIGKKYWYFLFSLLVIIPGIIAIWLYGLNLSIDFMGGSRITLSIPDKVSPETVSKISNALSKEKIKYSSIERSDKLVFIRTQPLDQTQNNKFIADLKREVKDFKEEEFETIGPTIGSETTVNAFYAVLLASLLPGRLGRSQNLQVVLDSGYVQLSL